MPNNPQTFDTLLLSQVRLGIVSTLMVRRELTFSELKSILGLTQGNLGIHLKKLEESGYVSITKTFVDNKPCTTAGISEVGHEAFLAHVKQLESVAQGRFQSDDSISKEK